VIDGPLAVLYRILAWAYSPFCMLVKSPSSSPSCRRFSTLLALLLLHFLFVHSASAEKIKDIRPSGYVTDLAGVIEPATKIKLENLCTELEQKTGAQMAIVTVHSLEGESVEQYAVDLYKQLGAGSKQDNRGVLLLLSPNEHKYRVEVGYGLEPVINDARAGDAGRAMVPLLRQGDYSNAVFTAAWQLANYIAADRGVTLSSAPPARLAKTERGGESSSFPLLWVVFFIFIVIRILAAAIRHTSGRRGGGGGWWVWPIIGGLSGGGFGGSSSGWSGGGGFGGGSSGGGGASGSW
jgi:uncharacterized protein